MPKLIYRVFEHKLGIVKEWYKNEWGYLHREGGPAVIEPDANHWYKEDKRHREDGPAAIYDDGTKFYFLNDEDVDPY